MTPESDWIDKYLREFGILVVAYSDMEYRMKIFASHLINPNDDTGHILVDDMPFQPLLAKLMSLYRMKQKDIKLVGKFEKLLSNIDSLGTKRNNIIHSSWHFWSNIAPNETALRIKSKAKFNGFKVEKVVVTITEIKGLTKDISKAIITLNKFKKNWQDNTIVV